MDLGDDTQETGSLVMASKANATEEHVQVHLHHNQSHSMLFTTLFFPKWKMETK
jgi:hypothetical protein